MFKQFIKDSTIYGVSTFFARIIVFLLLPLYTHLLTPEDFGVVEVLTVFSNFVNVTIALEISQALVRYYPDPKLANEKKIYAFTALIFTIFAYTVFLVLSVLFSKSLALILLSTTEMQNIFIFSVMANWFYGVFYLSQVQLRIELRSIEYAICNLVINFVTIFTTLFFVLNTEWGAFGVILGQGIGNLIGCFTAFFYIKSSYILSFNRKYLQEMLTFSFPLVLSSLGLSTILYSNRFFLGDVSLEYVGLLSVVYRVIAPINLLTTSIQTAIAPLMFSAYQNSEAKKEFSQIFHFLSAVAFLIFLGMSLFSQEIIKVMASEEYYPVASLIPYAILSTLISGMTSFAPGLYIEKKTWIASTINIVGGIFTVFLSYILIESLGLYGAVLAPLIGNAITFILYMAFSQKYYYVQYNFTSILIGLMFSIFFLAYSNYSFQEVNFINTFMKTILLVFFCIILIFLKLIEKEKLILLYINGLSYIKPFIKFFER